MKTWTTVPRPDKAAWGPGPWVDEPDKAQWTDPTTGLPCLAVRSLRGDWCGYVGVNPGHPYHGRAPWDLPLVAHGGLNYGAPCQQNGRVCHEPEPGEPENVWWFGFDCGHSHMDYVPAVVMEMRRVMGSHMPSLFEETEYRTLEYVQTICLVLACQLADIEGDDR